MTTLNRIVLTLIITALAAGSIAAQQDIEQKITNLGPKEAAPNKLKRDAERGDPRAQFLIGEEYDRAKDYKNAFVWFEKSAMQSYADGQWRLGAVYWRRGSGTADYGTAKDDRKAVRWFLKAAKQRHIFAMQCLSMMYYYGSVDVPSDLVGAYMWELVCSSIRDHDSYAGIVAMLREKMTAEQLSEGERRASKWLTQHPEPIAAKQ